MQRIIIKNFGPIEFIDLDVKDILIFIGPQASGKSTISKSIYFFKFLRDDLLKYILESIENEGFEKPLGTFSKRIRNIFLEFWGPCIYDKNMTLDYQYGNGASITINVKEKFINPCFNDKFQEDFFNIINEAKIFIDKTGKTTPKFLTSSEILSNESQKRIFFNRISFLVNELFNDHKDLIFIPAGRSLLATLSDQLQAIHPHKLDYLMKLFIERINNSKNSFIKSMEDLILDKKKLTQEKIEFDNIAKAQSIIEKILKAKYKNDSEGEKLFYDKLIYDNEKYVKLNFASSGQQESIWILLLIFLLILDNRHIFIVFEEPEAHLYPEAQKDIIDLISLVSNVLDSQIIITTHSPYILSSFNNLFYAYNLSKKSPGQVEKIINQKFWINHEKIAAYFIADGIMTNIIDDETDLIKTEAIDSASEIINSIYQKLFDLDE